MQNEKKLLPTSLVGSYAQPNWLIDRLKLASDSPPRVKRNDLWNIDEKFLQEAQDDATILAIRDQEKAGIDILTDGEIRRESYSNRFATALEGIDKNKSGTAISRKGTPNAVPLVVGPIRRPRPIGVRDIEFLRTNTDKEIKATLPGPFTMSQQAEDTYYKDPFALAKDYAHVVNLEIKDLFAAGADVVQIDEPFLQARPEEAKKYAIEVINIALNKINGTTALHLCMGYAAMIKDRPSIYHFLPELADTSVDQISVETAQPNLDLSILKSLSNKKVILGVLNLGDNEVETPDIVAKRIEKVFPYIHPESIITAPDCGFKYMSREISFSKLKALVEGSAIVRKRLTS